MKPSKLGLPLIAFSGLRSAMLALAGLTGYSQSDGSAMPDDARGHHPLPTDRPKTRRRFV